MNLFKKQGWVSTGYSRIRNNSIDESRIHAPLVLGQALRVPDIGLEAFVSADTASRASIIFT